MTELEKRVWTMIEPGVEDLGLRLVRVRLSGTDTSSQLQIMIEPQAAGPGNPVSVTVEECEQVSRMASALLDVEDPISSAYTLEVSSTGMERPLVTADDFKRYVGHRAKVELVNPVDGRKRFNGVLENMDGDTIVFRQEGEETPLNLPYTALKKARLIFTDEDFEQMMNSK